MRGRTAGGQGPTQGIGDLAQERGGGQKTGEAGDESDIFSMKKRVTMNQYKHFSPWVKSKIQSICNGNPQY